MAWTHEKIQILEGLREKFLSPQSIQGPYWDSMKTLEAYDEFFGRRNSWKIQFVLKDLFSRRPELLQTLKSQKKLRVLDWGCGSGTFLSTFLESLESRQVHSKMTVSVFDHSDLAMEFSTKKIKSQFKTCDVVAFDSQDYLESTEFKITLISHTINEGLPAAALNSIRDLIKNSDLCIWVETGRKQESNLLVQFRNEFLTQNSEFQILGPCLHNKACPIAGEKDNWCHFTFRPPSESSQDGDWVKIQKIMGIDGRYLSTSFCAFGKISRFKGEIPNTDKESFRVLGATQELKGHFKLLCCFEKGPVQVQTLSKKEAPLWYKETQKRHKTNREILLGQANIKNEKLLAGEWIGYDD